MKRTTVLRAAIAEAQHAHNVAINARSKALQTVSNDPSNGAAHKALDAAAAAVRALSDRLDALNDALVEARRLDDIDSHASKRADWIAARNQAVTLSAARSEVAKSLQKALDGVSSALVDFEAKNDAVLQSIYEAVQGAEPSSSPADAMMFGQRVGAIAQVTSAGIRNAFVLALYDVLHASAFDLNGCVEFHNPSFLGHGERGLAAAVERSTQGIEYALDHLHKTLGILPADPVEEAPPPIAPPQETLVMVKDPLTGEMTEQAYTVDATEVVWDTKP